MDHKEITQEEKEFMVGMNHSINVDGQKVSKQNAVKMREIYNKYSGQRDDYCMCSHFKRNILAKEVFLKWFNELDI